MDSAQQFIFQVRKLSPNAVGATTCRQQVKSTTQSDWHDALQMKRALIHDNEAFQYILSSLRSLSSLPRYNESNEAVYECVTCESHIQPSRAYLCSTRRWKHAAGLVKDVWGILEVHGDLQQQFAAFVPARLQPALAGRSAIQYSSPDRASDADRHFWHGSSHALPPHTLMHSVHSGSSQSPPAPSTPPQPPTQGRSSARGAEATAQSDTSVAPQYNQVFQHQPWQFDTKDLDACVAPLHAIRAFARGVAAAAQQQAHSVADAADKQAANASHPYDQVVGAPAPVSTAQHNSPPPPSRAAPSEGQHEPHGTIDSGTQNAVQAESVSAQPIHADSVVPLSPVLPSSGLKSAPPSPPLQSAGGQPFLAPLAPAPLTAGGVTPPQPRSRQEALRGIRAGNALVDGWQQAGSVGVDCAARCRTLLAGFHSGVLTKPHTEERLMLALQGCPVDYTGAIQEHLLQWEAAAAAAASATAPALPQQAALPQAGHGAGRVAHAREHALGPLALSPLATTAPAPVAPAADGAAGGASPSGVAENGSVLPRHWPHPPVLSTAASPELLQQWLLEIRSLLIQARAQSPHGGTQDTEHTTDKRASPTNLQAKAFEFKQAAWELARSR